jgi:hypothetical protein
MKNLVKEDYYDPHFKYEDTACQRVYTTGREY